MYSMPWVIGGDFNEILHLSEKYGGSNICSSPMDQFRDIITQCGLVDFGYEGVPFTWTNNQAFPATIQERLDRYVVTQSWKSIF